MYTVYLFFFNNDLQIFFFIPIFHFTLVVVVVVVVFSFDFLSLFWRVEEGSEGRRVEYMSGAQQFKHLTRIRNLK